MRGSEQHQGPPPWRRVAQIRLAPIENGKLECLQVLGVRDRLEFRNTASFGTHAKHKEEPSPRGHNEPGFSVDHCQTHAASLFQENLCDGLRALNALWNAFPPRSRIGSEDDLRIEDPHNCIEIAATQCG